MVRVSSKVKALTGKIVSNTENDKMITGAGLILFWPAFFFVEALSNKKQNIQNSEVSMKL